MRVLWTIFCTHSEKTYKQLKLIRLLHKKMATTYTNIGYMQTLIFRSHCYSWKLYRCIRFCKRSQHVYRKACIRTISLSRHYNKQTKIRYMHKSRNYEKYIYLSASKSHRAKRHSTRNTVRDKLESQKQSRYWHKKSDHPLITSHVALNLLCPHKNHTVGIKGVVCIVWFIRRTFWHFC